MRQYDDERLQYIDMLVKMWANWACRREDGELNGYASKTLEYELIEMGGVMIRSKGQKLPPVNDDAEQIEKAMHEMSDHPRYKELAQILIANYIGLEGVSNNLTWFGISKSTFRAKVKDGLRWIDVWLYTQEKKQNAKSV